MEISCGNLTEYAIFMEARGVNSTFPEHQHMCLIRLICTMKPYHSSVDIPFAEVEGAKAAAKSKAAKKNEKRKQKKGETGPDMTTAARKQSDSIADQVEAMKYVTPCPCFAM